jgi:hypothetical protein
MAALVLQAMCLARMIATKLNSLGAYRGRRTRRPGPARRSPRSCTLDLSRSRIRHAARQVVGRRESAGNFHLDIETVLKDLGAFAHVSFAVEPVGRLPCHPDCRHVVFRPNGDVSVDRFRGIMRAVKARAEFDARRPWWVCSLGEDHPRAACMGDRRPGHRGRCAICGCLFDAAADLRDLFPVLAANAGQNHAAQVGRASRTSGR